MLRFALLTLAGLAFANQSYAAPDCAAFTRAFEGGIKSAALDFVETIGETSAVRAANAQASIANDYAVAQMNLTLLIQNKCPLPERPVAIGNFLVDAVNCRTATLKGEKQPHICDQSLWKPNYGT